MTRDAAERAGICMVSWEGDVEVIAYEIEQMRFGLVRVLSHEHCILVRKIGLNGVLQDVILGPELPGPNLCV